MSLSEEELKMLEMLKEKLHDVNETVAIYGGSEYSASPTETKFLLALVDRLSEALEADEPEEDEKVRDFQAELLHEIGEDEAERPIAGPEDVSDPNNK